METGSEAIDRRVMANQNILGYTTAGFMARARATGLFVSLCTIQQPDTTLSGPGVPQGTWTNVSGLVNLACMDAPTSVLRILSDEIRNNAEITTSEKRHVLLADYYPTVIAGWAAGWRAIVDGITYDIAGAESDSQGTQTRLELRAVAT